MWIRGDFFTIWMFWGILMLLVLIDGRGVETGSKLTNGYALKDERRLSGDNLGLGDQLHVTCTDCQDAKASSENHKVRHAHRKRLKNSRHINDNPSSVHSNSSPAYKTPLQILFRTYVNGIKASEWTTTHKNFTKPKYSAESEATRQYSEDRKSENTKHDKENTEISDTRSSKEPDDIIDIDVDLKDQLKDFSDDKLSTKSDDKLSTNSDDKLRKGKVSSILIDDDSTVLKVHQLKDFSEDKLSTNSDDKLSTDSSILIDDDPTVLKDTRKYISEKSTIGHGKVKDHTKHHTKGKNEKSTNTHHGHHGKNTADRKLKKSPSKKHSLGQIIKDSQNQDPYLRRNNMGQKLYNQLQVPVRSMLLYMDQLEDKIFSKSKDVSYMSDLAFNITRYTMMNGARNIIQDIITINNDVYNIVVEASELTRSIYRRAHKRQTFVVPVEPLTLDTEMGVNKGLKFHDIAVDFQKVQQQYNDIKMKKMKSQQVADRVRQIREKLEENLGHTELSDLIFHANQTTIKLEAEFRKSMAIRQYDRYRNSITDVELLTMDGRDLLRESRDLIRTTTINTRGNIVAHQDNKRTKTKRQISGVDGGDLPPISLLRPPSSSGYSPEDRAVLLPLIRQASRHAAFLQKVSADAKRLLEPMIKLGKDQEQFSNGRGSSSSSSNYLATKIINTIKKLYPNLNDIKSLIQFNKGLPVHCIFSEESDHLCIESKKEEDDGCTEGSTCDLIEGSASDSDGASPTTDMDFEFQEERGIVSEGPLKLVFTEFGVALHKHNTDKKHTLQTTFDKATNISLSVTRTSVDWTETKEKVESAVYQAKQSSDFRTSWLQDKSNFKEISEKVSSMSTSISITTNNIQQQCRIATEKSESLVGLMQAIKQGASNNVDVIEGSAADGNDYDDDDDGDDDGEIVDVSTVKEGVKKVTTKLSSLNRLRVETPVLCGNVQDRISTMRSAISALKEKVDRARLILSSMKLGVSVDESSYITSRIDRRSDYLSVITEIEVCIKPASNDGILLVVDGNSSDSYTLEMDTGLLQLVLKDVNREEKTRLSADGALDLDTWYTIRIIRVGPNLTMWVNTTDGENRNKITVTTDTEHHQPDPGTVYVGGAPANVISSGFFAAAEFAWKGCVSGLFVNGKVVSVFAKNQNGVNPKPCNSSCQPRPKEQTAIRFSGAGYVEYPARFYYRRPSVTSVSIEFRTSQSAAFIMSIHHKQERFQLEVLIKNGTLVIETTTPTESILLKSEKPLNDNYLHELKISYRDSTTYPEVDGVDGLFSINRQPRTHIRRDGILLGGKLSISPPESSEEQPNLIGCLRNLKINDALINIFEMTSFENIHIGPCFTHDVWDNCVKFDEKSKTVQLIDQENIKLLDLNIGRNSVGQLLQYEKTSKFDLTLVIKEGVLHINEAVKEFTADIVFPPNRTFIPIVVKDDTGEKLVITVLGEERTIGYGGGGGWWYGGGDDDDDDVTYNIKLGINDGEANEQFIGEVSEFAVNYELQNLVSRSYKKHLLTSCIRKDHQTLVKEKHLVFESCR